MRKKLISSFSNSLIFTAAVLGHDLGPEILERKVSLYPLRL